MILGFHVGNGFREQANSTMCRTRKPGTLFSCIRKPPSISSCCSLCLFLSPPAALPVGAGTGRCRFIRNNIPKAPVSVEYLKVCWRTGPFHGGFPERKGGIPQHQMRNCSNCSRTASKLNSTIQRPGEWLPCALAGQADGELSNAILCS